MAKITSDIRLLLTTKDHGTLGGSDAYLTATAHVVIMTDDGIRNLMFGHTYTGEPGHDVVAYDSLTVHANCDGKDWYGWSVEYRDVFSVDLPRAQSMAATLKRINTRMAALDQRFGPADTFPAYLARVADALGVRYPSPYGMKDNRRSSGYTYADNAYRWMDTAALRYALDTVRTEFRKTHNLDN